MARPRKEESETSNEANTGKVFEFETCGIKDKVQSLLPQHCSTSSGGDVYLFDRIIACEDVSDPKTRYWALRVESETGWIDQSKIDSLVATITQKDGGFVLGKDKSKSNEAINAIS